MIGCTSLQLRGLCAAVNAHISSYIRVRVNIALRSLRRFCEDGISVAEVSPTLCGLRTTLTLADLLDVEVVPVFEAFCLWDGFSTSVSGASVACMCLLEDPKNGVISMTSSSISSCGKEWLQDAHYVLEVVLLIVIV